MSGQAPDESMRKKHEGRLLRLAAFICLLVYLCMSNNKTSVEAATTVDDAEKTGWLCGCKLLLLAGISSSDV
jgi:hypothetical protein